MKKRTIKLLTLWSGTLIARTFLNIEKLLGTPHFVIVTPLLGSFLSLPQVCGALTFLTTMKWLLGGLPITLGIPSAGAALSWSASRAHSASGKIIDGALHVLLPLVCIGLFVLHPVGSHAWPYAMYWLIPICLWVIRFFFSTPIIYALQSTFIAHALGSIMWLYQVPMSSEQWLALIPLVAVERLVMAGTMTILYETGMILGGTIGTARKKIFSYFANAL